MLDVNNREIVILSGVRTAFGTISRLAQEDDGHRPRRAHRRGCPGEGWQSPLKTSTT